MHVVLGIVLSTVDFVEILFHVCLSFVYRGECKSLSEEGDVNGSGKYHILGILPSL